MMHGQKNIKLLISVCTQFHHLFFGQLHPHTPVISMVWTLMKPKDQFSLTTFKNSSL